MHSTNVRQRKRGAPGSSLPQHDTGQLSPGAGGRWYDVPSVRIESTGSQLLQEGLTWFSPAGVLARAPTGPARSAGEECGRASHSDQSDRSDLQKRFDRSSLVHGIIGFFDIIQVSREVEDESRMNASL